MGHRLTNKGVQPGPSKVAAITGMPTLADKATVQCFLRKVPVLVQVLAKPVGDSPSIEGPN